MESVEPCFRICNPSIPLQKLGRRENTDLKFQLKVFHEHREEDFDEFVQRFDNTRPDLEDSAECFDVLRHSVSETPSEPFLLSILQHLLFIRDDPNTKSVKTRYIFFFISRIINHTPFCSTEGCLITSSSKNVLLKLSSTKMAVIPISPLLNDSKSTWSLSLMFSRVNHPTCNHSQISSGYLSLTC